MRSFHFTLRAASGIALVLLTGCASGANIAGPAVGGGELKGAVRAETAGPAALRSLSLASVTGHGTGAAAHPFIDFAAMAKNKGDTIAISEPGNNVVDLFTAAGKQVGVLTGFNKPFGLASDIKGDLYVADYDNARVQVYAAGFASPPTTLSDPGQLPYGVDSFGNGAYVAVVNSASVSIFKGATMQNTIAVPGTPLSCAFDASGNLYLTTNLGNKKVRGAIYEIPNATSGGTKVERLTTMNRINFANGIQVTTADQIAIEGDRAIYSYDPPSAGSLGAPKRITPLGGGLPVFTSFAFTRNMANLYTATDGHDNYKYAYPAGGKPRSDITTSGFAYGMAVIPTQYPKNNGQ